MAHEITSTDGLVLHKQRAWHGLGTIVEQAPTPREALKLAGLNWEVEQWVLSATDGQQRVTVPKHVMNVRKDTLKQLGIVGSEWQPFQNDDLADFCESLAESGEVKIESAGSIRGGEKVWFLLKGDSFAVRQDDVIAPYVLVSNGFDGKTALRITPTTIRVVCSNTLHMVIGETNSESSLRQPGKLSAFSCLHLGTLKERVEAARKALKNYGKLVEDNRTMIDALATRDVNSKSVERFFLECYTKHFGAVADNPKDAGEKRKRDQAIDCVGKCIRTFEKEEKIAGATAWNAFNAYSRWLQHDRQFWKNPEVAAERKIDSNLFGVSSDRTVEAFRLAFTLSV